MGEEKIKQMLREQRERGISFEHIKENCKTVGDLKNLVESFAK